MTSLLELSRSILFLLHYHASSTFNSAHSSFSLSLSLSVPPPLLPPQGSSSSGRTRSFSLLPHLTPSSSPGSQRHLSHVASPSNIVTITHHKSPAAARRAKHLYPGRLLEVKEVGVRGVRICIQPRALRRGVQRRESIDALPTRGPLSCLDQDLLLLKATSAATLGCLGECLNILQQTQSRSRGPPPSHGSQCDYADHGAPSVPSSGAHHQRQGPAGLWLLSLPDGYHEPQCLY
ncbi:Oxysterol-binding protein-related protein 10 [Liparis tanakae]|uniref:Oxysterol-binding protein-related protein 10 n=1 Tax=Liparis tanakae TaxID=230148 RepID=A0A4Z2GQT2_9TELE|nr:Oxysterol-binding protein-related protein 10 [Liparis tanakae]